MRFQTLIQLQTTFFFFMWRYSGVIASRGENEVTLPVCVCFNPSVSGLRFGSWPGQACMLVHASPSLWNRFPLSSSSFVICYMTSYFSESYVVINGNLWNLDFWPDTTKYWKISHWASGNLWAFFPIFWHFIYKTNQSLNQENNKQIYTSMKIIVIFSLTFLIKILHIFIFVGLLL